MDLKIMDALYSESNGIPNEVSNDMKQNLHDNGEPVTSNFHATTASTARVQSQKEKSVGALQQLSSLLCQTMPLESVADLKGSLPTVPINDLRGEEASSYHREDCILRRSLAALYRLIDTRGWTQSIYNHISARCTTNSDHFFINPFGLLHHEIQASSLVKIDSSGNVIEQGSSVLGVNKAGWTLHSALHSARKDVNCIIHVHLPDVIAVSCLRIGLLPVSNEAIELLTNVGVRYHDYHGILVDEAERSSIENDLGQKAKILFLRNHGVAVAATNIPEAWYLLKRLISACQTQMRLMQLNGGASFLNELKEIATQIVDAGDNVENCATETACVADDSKRGDISVMNGKANSENEPLWTPEELEFEAEMRVLDSAGFRTGHIYRQPNLLRRAHPGSTWAGDTLGDQITGAELLTTDFSTNEFSAAEDIAAAEAAGAEQVAKIVDHVRTSRQRSAQRNHWLAKSGETAKNGLVTSSLISSPVNHWQRTETDQNRPFPFDSPKSNTSTPVKRPECDNVHNDTTYTNYNESGVHNGSIAASAISNSLTHSDLNSTSRHTPQYGSYNNKSATLPSNVQHLVAGKNNTTNTLQSADGVFLSDGVEETETGAKKVKKKRSLRIPSFSLRRKQ